MNWKTGTFLTLTIAFLIFLPGWTEARQKLSLDEFLDFVHTESPDLSIESANVAAFKARSSGIRIPPGMVGFMQMQSGGDTAKGLEVAQEIPFPTKIAQDKKSRRLEYEAQKKMSAIQEVTVSAKARVAYIEFWAASTRLAILKEKHDWLHHHAKLNRTLTISDNAAQIHLLGIESEADLLENDILSEEAYFVEARNALNSFAPSLKGQDFIVMEPVLEKAKAGESQNPLVAWKEEELKAKKARVALAKQSYLPDLYVRFRAYEGMPTVQANQELMVGVTVPFLNFWQPRAEVKEASAQKAKAYAELEKVKVESDSRLSALLKKSEAMKSQISVLKNKLIPRAARRAELVKNISQRTMEGLDEHKTVMLDYLDLKLKSIDLRLAYEKNFQEIRQLTGNP